MSRHDNGSAHTHGNAECQGFDPEVKTPAVLGQSYDKAKTFGITYGLSDRQPLERGF